MIDEVLSHNTGSELTIAKAVSANATFFSGPLSTRSTMPIGILSETIAQAGGWLVNQHYDFKVLAIVSLIEGLNIKSLIRPGDFLVCKAALLDTGPEGSSVKVEAFVGNEHVVESKRLWYAHYRIEKSGLSERFRDWFESMSPAMKESDIE